MYMFVRMTIHIIVVWVFVMYISVRLSIHILIGFVMYIFVRMTTFSFWVDFRHVHFCTDDYLLILNGFTSCTFLYEWLPFLFEWIVVIYISVRMTTISFWMDCCHFHFYAPVICNHGKLRGRARARGAGLERLRTTAVCRFRARCEQPTSMA